MPASLPVPYDADPNHTDDAHHGASGQSASIVSLPPLPKVPAGEAAERDAASPTVAKKPPRKRPPRKKPVVDPGPPPPLPADLIAPDALSDIVIPPRPPLPPAVEVVEPEVVEAEVVEPEAVEPEVVEPEVVEAEVVAPEVIEAEVVAPEVVEAVVVEPEDVEPEADAVDAPVVEPVPLAEPEPEPETEPEPVDLEPEPVDLDDDTTVRTEVAATAFAVDIDTDTAALVVKGVSKSFGSTRAVDGIDLTIPAGTFYGLVGPNGAGKTTTLSMIAGLLRPDRGSIRVNGVDAASDPLGAKRQMGVLPDRLRTFDRLTGRQLLHYYGVLRGLASPVVESRTADLARAFDLSDALGRVVSDYSAGMVKKVMLAGALIHSPRLLVLDEPFEAVDPVSSAIILDILSTYVAHGGTVILSSHGMELVERVCSRVAVIVAGQVLVEGTVEEVRGELTLEQRFIELAGGLGDVEGLEWLHTFSG